MLGTASHTLTLELWSPAVHGLFQCPDHELCQEHHSDPMWLPQDF